MLIHEQHMPNHARYTPPATLHMIWLIAWRQMDEAVRNRSTLILAGFSVIFPLVIVLFSLRDVMTATSPSERIFVGTIMAFYLLWAGLMPSTPAIGIASGVFAGDKERGCLTPLLVTPASNTALFAGKVLGSVLPALALSLIAILAYLAEIALLFGFDKLALLPLGLTLLILLAIPAITIFGTGLASIISSRVTTFQAAQNYSSLILVVLWVGLFGLLFAASAWGLWTFALGILAIFVLDALLIAIAAATWKREEVMGKQ
ncbi:MAG: ABC transporter permease [Ktedonobacteraceae bacterium]